jgi:hypothetical protein
LPLPTGTHPGLRRWLQSKEDAMSQEILLPMLGIFGALAAATVIAYVLLNNDDLHTRGKH